MGQCIYKFEIIIHFENIKHLMILSLLRIFILKVVSTFCALKIIQNIILYMLAAMMYILIMSTITRQYNYRPNIL